MVAVQKVHDILRDAWDAEGSPFKGQPFDPSVVNISPSGMWSSPRNCFMTNVDFNLNVIALFHSPGQWILTDDNLSKDFFTKYWMIVSIVYFFLFLFVDFCYASALFYRMCCNGPNNYLVIGILVQWQSKSTGTATVYTTLLRRNSASSP